ncbi:MAG: hypothetical protein AB1941_11120 [Gemmatimonadota bacterium]
MRPARLPLALLAAASLAASAPSPAAAFGPATVSPALGSGGRAVPAG